MVITLNIQYVYSRFFVSFSKYFSGTDSCK